METGNYKLMLNNKYFFDVIYSLKCESNHTSLNDCQLLSRKKEEHYNYMLITCFKTDFLAG